MERDTTEIDFNSQNVAWKVRAISTIIDFNAIIEFMTILNLFPRLCVR